MGLFSWLFKRKKSEKLRQYLGNDADETANASSSDNKADKVDSKAKKEKTSNTKRKTKKIDFGVKATSTDVKTAPNTNSDPVPTSNTEKTKTTSGFFDIKKSKDDRYVFNLYASNKMIIATSRVYSSAQSALNGINSVITTAERAEIEDQTAKQIEETAFPKWEIYKDKGGSFRFRLMAQNGICICRSQGYTTKANCKNGIESIIRTVKDAKVDKSYLKK